MLRRVWSARRALDGGSTRSLALNGWTMNRAEFRHYHEREAMRLRSLITNATTSALKAWLSEEVAKHERLADGELVERADLAPSPE